MSMKGDDNEGESLAHHLTSACPEKSADLLKNHGMTNLELLGFLEAESKLSARDEQHHQKRFPLLPRRYDNGHQPITHPCS